MQQHLAPSAVRLALRELIAASSNDVAEALHDTQTTVNAILHVYVYNHCNGKPVFFNCSEVPNTLYITVYSYAYGINSINTMRTSQKVRLFFTSH